MVNVRRHFSLRQLIDASSALRTLDDDALAAQTREMPRRACLRDRQGAGDAAHAMLAAAGEQLDDEDSLWLREQLEQCAS
jgi:hypothetical protein